MPILHPSVATPAAAWPDPGALVVVVPEGDAPAALNGVAFARWQPSAADWWGAEAVRSPVAEPPFVPRAGLAPAAGVVLVEPDGRVWLAQPSNGFGGIAHVAHEGRHDAGLLSAAAMREAWEDLGLVARLTGHLVDVPRTMTFTRYYVGRRVGGSPVCMGWESQSCLLVPASRLGRLLNGPHDGPLVAAIRVHLRQTIAGG